MPLGDEILSRRIKTPTKKNSDIFFPDKVVTSGHIWSKIKVLKRKAIYKCGCVQFIREQGPIFIENFLIVLVDGKWGSWSAFGSCDRPCGPGRRRAVRGCNNPEPSIGGKQCEGPNVKYQACNLGDCIPGTYKRKQSCVQSKSKSVY